MKRELPSFDGKLLMLQITGTSFSLVTRLTMASKSLTSLMQQRKKIRKEHLNGFRKEKKKHCFDLYKPCSEIARMSNTHFDFTICRSFKFPPLIKITHEINRHPLCHCLQSLQHKKRKLIA